MTMKKLFFSLAILVVSIFVSTEATAQIEKGAKIEFNKETHDYGNIKYDADPYCTFEFKNTGDEPLIISNAKGSCGCTVPEWPKEPIAPGASGEINVEFNSKGKPGQQHKQVTVTANTTPTETFLVIKGTVRGKEQPVSKGGK